MKSFAQKVLDLLPSRVDYADCRVVETKRKKIATKDGVVEELDLAGNAPRIAQEAVELIEAEDCPQGEDEDVWRKKIKANHRNNLWFV